MLEMEISYVQICKFNKEIILWFIEPWIQLN